MCHVCRYGVRCSRRAKTRGSGARKIIAAEPRCASVDARPCSRGAVGEFADDHGDCGRPPNRQRRLRAIRSDVENLEALCFLAWKAAVILCEPCRRPACASAAACGGSARREVFAPCEDSGPRPQEAHRSGAAGGGASLRDAAPPLVAAVLRCAATAAVRQAQRSLHRRGASLRSRRSRRHGAVNAALGELPP